MYTGTDLDGNQSPLTRYGNNPDYGSFPLIPDPNQPYFGPGYKLIFPIRLETVRPVIHRLHQLMILMALIQRV